MGRAADSFQAGECEIAMNRTHSARNNRFFLLQLFQNLDDSALVADSRARTNVFGECWASEVDEVVDQAIGQRIRINSVPVEIIGVLESKGQAAGGMDRRRGPIFRSASPPSRKPRRSVRRPSASAITSTPWR